MVYYSFRSSKWIELFWSDRIINAKIKINSLWQDDKHLEPHIRKQENNIKKLFDTFGLSSEIVEALTALRYFHPTPVQESGIPSALENKDIIVESQTGSGKTVAFGIPLV